MGIWKVCRLLARRWPVSVPLFLLTGGAALVAALNVQPHYVGTAHVFLLEPGVRRTPAPGQPLAVNPWDTQTLASAVVVRLNTGSFARQMAAEGFRSGWQVSLDERTGSVVRVAVTSPSRAAAGATLARLLRAVDDEVARQQAGYPGLTPADKITTTRLDAPGEVEPSSANVQRAIAVVAIAGLLLTAAVTASVDAVLRHRARGWPGTAGDPRALATAAAPLATGAAPVGRASAGEASADTEATQPVVITNVPLQVPIPGAASAPLVHAARSAPAARASSDADRSPAQDDSTIVLPLSNAPWADRQRRVTAGGGVVEKDKNDRPAGVGWP